jgi:hypothetical protein
MQLAHPEELSRYPEFPKLTISLKDSDLVHSHSRHPKNDLTTSGKIQGFVSAGRLGKFVETGNRSIALFELFVVRFLRGK